MEPRKMMLLASHALSASTKRQVASISPGFVTLLERAIGIYLIVHWIQGLENASFDTRKLETITTSSTSSNQICESR